MKDLLPKGYLVIGSSPDFLWANFYKNTRITERVNFQFRFEVFNLFNRANLSNVNVNVPDGNFGKATAARIPRFWQLGGKLSF
jgi:hypothetical protein